MRQKLDPDTQALLDKVCGSGGQFDLNAAVESIIEIGLSSAQDTLSQLSILSQATRRQSAVESTLKRAGFRPSVSQELSRSFSKLPEASKPQVLSNLVDQILNKPTSSNDDKVETLLLRLPDARAEFSDFTVYLDTMKTIIERHLMAGTASQEMVDRLVAYGHVPCDPKDPLLPVRNACLVHPQRIAGMNTTELDVVQNALSAGMSPNERAQMEALIGEKYTRTEILMAIIAKRQYNEDMTFDDLFKLLNRGHELVHTLQSDAPFQLRDDGEDVPALMWYLKAKEDIHMSHKGSSGVTFPPGESGLFLQKFIDAGAQPRISTHYPVMRIGGTSDNQGWGKDVPDEALRIKTPFGLGSILIHPIVKRTADLHFVRQWTSILKNNDLMGFLELDSDIPTIHIVELLQEAKDQPLTEIQVARRLQRIGQFDFDLGIKFESSGFGDTQAQHVAHAAGSGAGSLAGLRPDLIGKKSSELKLALQGHNAKAPTYSSRREFMDDFGAENANALNQLARLVPGYGIRSVDQWKPEEFKLSTDVIAGGTFTELIWAAESHVRTLVSKASEITDEETTQVQQIRELVATIKSALHISDDDVNREGNEHRISIETGYIAPYRSVSRSGSRSTSPCYLETPRASHSSDDVLKSLHLDPDTESFVIEPAQQGG